MHQSHILPCLLGTRLVLCIFGALVLIRHILEMTSVHHCRKGVFPFLFLCFKNNILFALHFIHLPRRDLLSFFHCSLRILNFHRLEHWNEFMHQIVMNKRIESFLCDVVVVISRKSRLQTLPCRFVSFHNTSNMVFLCG